jgi:hypothetical protein
MSSRQPHKKSFVAMVTLIVLLAIVPGGVGADDNSQAAAGH